MWYYAVDGTPAGPVDVATIRILLASGAIQVGTNVWKEGMPNWVPLASIPELAVLATPISSPGMNVGGVGSLSAQGVAGGYNSAAMASDLPTASKLRSLYTWYLWLSVVSIPLMFIIIGFFTAIAGVVVFFVLMHNCWKTVPANIARTTPGKAVGFCFIPFYNLYWMFVAVYGLGKDLNTALAQKGIQRPVVDEGLLLAGLILNFVPYVNLISWILLLVSWSQIKNAACMMVEN